MTLNKLMLCISMVITLALDSYAQKPDTSAQATIVDPSELSLEETLKIPEVPEKLSQQIRSYMKREGHELQKLGYKVETTRKGEILIVTIPSDQLFAPNDTVLIDTATKLLAPFISYLRTPGKFKIVLTMHSDDTGSSDYLHSLTEKRIIALYDYFDSKTPNIDSMQGYPMADSEPLAGVPNTSRANRALNRRLEIYILPGPTIIQEAKGKKI